MAQGWEWGGVIGMLSAGRPADLCSKEGKEGVKGRGERRKTCARDLMENGR